jgi:hypothetical protein
MLRILHVSTFGPRVRGISPYSDSLVGGLRVFQNIETFQLDFDKAFPSFLLPKDTDYSAANDYATIHYLSDYPLFETMDMESGKRVRL